MWKICLSGTETPIEGCESLTEVETQDWLSVNQEYFEEENEYGDTAKYVMLEILDSE